MYDLQPVSPVLVEALDWSLMFSFAGLGTWLFSKAYANFRGH